MVFFFKSKKLECLQLIRKNGCMRLSLRSGLAKAPILLVLCCDSIPIFHGTQFIFLYLSESMSFQFSVNPIVALSTILYSSKRVSNSSISFSAVPLSQMYPHKFQYS